jgi:hypothetical protein
MPTDQVTAPPASTSDRPTAVLGRLAGLGGLVFVALLVVQNVVRAAEPGFAASPAEVSDYFAGHRLAVVVPLALFPLGMVALLAFGAGLCVRAREHPTGRWFAAFGGLAVVVLAGLFALVNIVEIVIAVDTADLAGSPHVLSALWAMHAAAFGLNLTAIAIALVGLSQAARAVGLVPRAVAAVAWPGAACLFVASLATVAIAEGSAVLYLGFVGFVVWGVFVVVAGARLAAGPVPPAGLAARG